MEIAFLWAISGGVSFVALLLLSWYSALVPLDFDGKRLILGCFVVSLVLGPLTLPLFLAVASGEGH